LAKPVDEIDENAANRLTFVRYTNAIHYEAIIETICDSTNVRATWTQRDVPGRS
jgi:hypothetical protein